MENPTTASQQKASVVPLLAQLARAEEMVQAIAMRLDPITNHVPTTASDKISEISRTVTARLQTLGDTLQYLLDNIEL